MEDQKTMKIEMNGIEIDFPALENPIHKAIQREDGSVYCYCDNLPGETISVSMNYRKRSMICSCCGKEVTEQ